MKSLWRRLDHVFGSKRFQGWAIFGGLIVLAVIFAGELIGGRNLFWHFSRLIPAIIFREGLSNYYPVGEGPLFSQIYPPLAFITYVPVTFVKGILPMYFAGRTYSFLIYFLPALGTLFLIFRKTTSRASLPFFVGVLTFLTLTLGQHILRHAATYIHSDAPALFFVGLGTFFIVFYEQEKRAIAFFLAILSLVAAVFCKQSFGLAPLGYPVWLVLQGRKPEALKFILGSVFVGVVALVGTNLIYGFEILKFNLYTNPSSHPYNRGRLFLLFANLILFTLGFLLVFREYLRRSGKSVKKLIQKYSIPTLFLIIGFCNFPLAARATVKQAADINNLAPVFYFWSLAVAGTFIIFLGGKKLAASQRAMPGYVALACVLFLVNGSGKKALNDWKSLSGKVPTIQAFEYAKKYPGTVFFPNHPLATYMAEGRLYHERRGMLDYEHTGNRVSERHFFEHIPKNVSYICAYKKHPMRGPTRRYLAGIDNKKVRIPGLEGWSCVEAKRKT